MHPLLPLDDRIPAGPPIARGAHQELRIHWPSFVFAFAARSEYAPTTNTGTRPGAERAGTKRLDLGSQFDHVFWIGDLNYRTDLNAAAHAEHLAAGVLTPPPAPYGDEEKHHQAVLKLIEQEQWAKLYEADQLKMCQRKGDAFAGFRESPPNWAPTCAHRPPGCAGLLRLRIWPAWWPACIRLHGRARRVRRVLAVKVKRSQGTDYKNQRIPSYCDRVLWKSMPPLAALVEQTRYVSLPEVTTSDHKPVLAEFNVQPTETVFEVVAPPRTTSGFAVLAPLFSPRGLVGGSPSSPRGGDGGVRRNISGRRANRGARPSGPPLIRITHLELSNLMDMDMGGGSDPYCIFFTNPPGLLADDRHAPVTTVKNVKPKQRNTQLDSSTVTIDMPMERVSTVGGAASVTWSDKEMPLLRPKGVPPVKLPFVTLIIAVYDWDRVGVDDLLGVALVPLCPPTYVPGKSAPLKEEYDIPIDQKLVHGNMSAGVGELWPEDWLSPLDPTGRHDHAGHSFCAWRTRPLLSPDTGLTCGSSRVRVRGRRRHIWEHQGLICKCARPGSRSRSTRWGRRGSKEAFAPYQLWESVLVNSNTHSGKGVFVSSSLAARAPRACGCAQSCLFGATRVCISWNVWPNVHAGPGIRSKGRAGGDQKRLALGASGHATAMRAAVYRAWCWCVGVDGGWKLLVGEARGEIQNASISDKMTHSTTLRL